jgi:hypothetical protein
MNAPYRAPPPVCPQSKSLHAKPHDDFDISIIWQNIYAESDFVCFRKESQGPIERILIDFAKVLESGVFEEVVCVNASKHLFCVTVACTKNKDEGVMDAILSVI